LQFFCFCTATTNHNTWAGGMDVNTATVSYAFHFNTRNTGTRKLLFDELLNFKIFMEPFGIIPLAVPL